MTRLAACRHQKGLLCFLAHSENRGANREAIGGLMQRKGKEKKRKESKLKEIV